MATLKRAGNALTPQDRTDIKTDLALQNVDNTSDANKPISTATQTALALKADSSAVTAALGLKANTADLGAAAFQPATAFATAAQGTDAREWTAATVTQAEAEAGIDTTRRAFTAQRVRQAVAAWWTGISTAAGRAIVTAADAAAQRTAMGAAASGAIASSGLTQATARLLGRTTAGTGAPEEISVGTGLTLAGGTLSAVPGGGNSQGAANTVQLSDGAGAFLAATGVTWAGVGRLALDGGTLTASAPAVAVTQTWNNAAVTFNADDINITDTASAATSTVLNRRVGGASVFSVRKDGMVTIGNTRFGPVAGTAFLITSVGNNIASIGAFGAYVQSGGQFGWSSSSTNADAGGGSAFFYPAANTVALRNGTNAQTLRVNGTHTNDSNGRWVEFGMSTAGVGRLLATGNGSGATGNRLELQGDVRFTQQFDLAHFTTATRPAFQNGRVFFDDDIDKMVLGGATAWEVVTSA